LITFKIVDMKKKDFKNYKAIHYFMDNDCLKKWQNKDNAIDNYRTDWDWIMPVIEKIESLGYWVNRIDGDLTIVDEVGNIICCTPTSSGGIESYYLIAVDFCKKR